ICWIFLCRDRSRDNIQLNAPDEQTRSLPTIVPEHNQRRDPPLSGDDGALASDVPRVYGGTKTHRYSPDETGLHLASNGEFLFLRKLTVTRQMKQGFIFLSPLLYEHKKMKPCFIWRV